MPTFSRLPDSQSRKRWIWCQRTGDGSLNAVLVAVELLRIPPRCGASSPSFTSIDQLTSANNRLRHFVALLGTLRGTNWGNPPQSCGGSNSVLSLSGIRLSNCSEVKIAEVSSAKSTITASASILAVWRIPTDFSADTESLVLRSLVVLYPLTITLKCFWEILGNPLVLITKQSN